jgi:hypothetical protein
MAQPYNYSLNVPSPMQAFGQAFNVGAAGQKAKEAREARELALESQEEGNRLVNEYFETPADQRSYDQILQISMYNKPFADMAQKSFDMLSEQQQQSAFTDATQIHSALRNVLAGETDFEILDQILDRRIQATKGNPGLNKMWSDAREIARTNPEGAELMVATRIAALPGGKEYFATMKARGEESRAAQAVKAQTVKAKSPPRQKLRDAGIIGEPIKTTDADKYSNGLTMYRTDIGEIYGVDVRNNLLQGEELAEAAQEAQDFEAASVSQIAGARRRGALEVEKELKPELSELVARATKRGEISQQLAKDSYETTIKARRNLGNLDAAIAAVKAGANTGVIQNQFPNWKASSIELKNLQRQLGLDVIGSVTFGALSEGELELALETALDLNLTPAALLDLLVRKKDAQSKMIAELEKATMFFAAGGGLGEYVQLQQTYEVPTGAQTPIGQTPESALREMDAILGIN